ncbi:Copper(I)-binding protein [Modestobacter sp. DSM 44400]|uniref:copper chaperone PCu(A)C n=1 Tax=Modestobacter sp. DSM 44400 TaxID=1550230 RepID=UPI0008973FD6|nr:copper chaperone PCu(A)C [Modestobacter sp. DSM 44400]SDX90643.1 Copper(I)-binding protein [Modestobacter sp. DSM 44400]
MPVPEPPKSIRRWFAVVPLAAAVVLSGCGSAAPTETPQAEVSGGAIGPDKAVSADVKVLQVHLEYPLDGRYDVGEDASLYLGISNTGSVPDVLVDVSGPDFAEARTTGAQDGDVLAIEVPANDNVYVGAEGAPALTLVDLDRALRSSESIPVTFTFERAGTVTVDAMVAAEGQTPSATVDFPRNSGEPDDK